MTRLPAVTGQQVVSALERHGFVMVRVTGSHHRLVHPERPGSPVTVSVHAGKTLKRGTLRNIFKQSGLSVDEFMARL
ncbi:MAG: type II toxin-antitoxin system HicA family toxin [Hyphomicrobium sp.]